MAWVKRLLDQVIAADFGRGDLEFAWSEDREFDPLAAARIDDLALRSGSKLLNEVRDRLGLDPVPGGDGPMVLTPAGYVRLGQTLPALGKADWNPELHPRVPAGSPQGGQFTTGDGDDGDAGSDDERFYEGGPDPQPAATSIEPKPADPAPSNPSDASSKPKNVVEPGSQRLPPQFYQVSSSTRLTPEQTQQVHDRLVYLNGKYNPNSVSDRIESLLTGGLNDPSKVLTDEELKEQQILIPLWLSNYFGETQDEARLDALESSALGALAYVVADAAGASQQQKDGALQVGAAIGGIATAAGMAHPIPGSPVIGLTAGEVHEPAVDSRIVMPESTLSSTDSGSQTREDQSTEAQAGPTRDGEGKEDSTSQAVDSAGSPLKTIEQNGYTYYIDALGRTVRVTGRLVLAPMQGRNKQAQANAGGPDRLDTDDGGHFAGRRFNGPTGDDNHFAQDSNFNRGAYRVLEDKWQSELNEGKAVDIDIRATYSGDSMRPDELKVDYTVDGQPESRLFQNRYGGKRAR